MIATYKEYRIQNGTVPYLDILAYPDGYADDNMPQPVFSKWALNLKSTGNLDKGAVAGNAAKAVGGAFMSIISIGTGTGGVGAGLAETLNESGKAFSNIANSNMTELGMVADLFINYEKNYWEEYYRLMTFEPAEGNLGDEHIGKEDGNGRLGHWFYENGDYFEGYIYNDGQRQGIFIFANGLRYYGNIASGLKVGYGIEISPDGSRTYGLFENGALTTGIYQCDQCAMGGEWSEGVLNGSGFARYAENNRVFMGQWSHGRPVQ